MVSKIIVVGLAFGALLGCGQFKATPVDISSSLSSNSSLAVGSKLYAQNCQGCHGSLGVSSKTNKSATQILAAINYRPEMSALKSLSPSEIQAIADSLNSAIKASPFQCNDNSELPAATLRRLTKREYLATLQDLLGGTVAIAQLKTEIDQVDTETADSVPVIKLFDTTNPVPASTKIFLAFEGIATRVADILSAQTNTMNTIAGSSCISTTPVADSCVHSLLDSFGYRAYRRPLTNEEKAEYLALYRTGTSSTDSFSRVIQALLLAPQFLFHLTDQGTAMPNKPDVLALTPHEIASRLSYMLTGSMPDAALFEAARNGSLSSEAGIEQQVRRLMGQSRAKDHLREFYSQWLLIKNMPVMTPPQEVLNGIDVEAFRSEAKQEVIDVMDELIWARSAKLNDLFTTRLISPKGPMLTQIYGQSSTGLQESSDPNRVGILTRPGLLAKSIVANSDPIRRGVRVRVHLLCDSLGTPPANVDVNAPPPDPLDSTRNRITAKTSSSACMSCHQRINGLGFPFENFDGFGRFRQTETVVHQGQARVHNINAVSVPNLEFAQESPVNGASELQVAITKTTRAPACLTTQYFQFQNGREPSHGDECSLAHLYSALVRSGADGSIKTMFQAITGTPIFRTKKLN